MKIEYVCEIISFEVLYFFKSKIITYEEKYCSLQYGTVLGTYWETYPHSGSSKFEFNSTYAVTMSKIMNNYVQPQSISQCRRALNLHTDYNELSEYYFIVHWLVDFFILIFSKQIQSCRESTGSGSYILFK